MIKNYLPFIIAIDGKSQDIKRFDGFCTYWRSHFIFLEALKNGIHDVEIKVTGEKFDKKTVMKPNDDPAKYAGFDWYPVGVLITGNIQSQIAQAKNQEAKK